MNAISESQPEKIKKNTGILILENGHKFFGYGLGYEGTAVGEVCFNTSITGYQEIITDPSYSDQIINFTFPHIGNVGTNTEDNESLKPWVKGVIFNTEITDPSNYRSLKKLDLWLKQKKIVGVIGIDTRALTGLIRDKGAPKATICHSLKSDFDHNKLQQKAINWNGLEGLDLASKVSCQKIFKWHSEKTWKKDIGYKKNKKKKYNIVAIDYGIKLNILRCFSDLDCQVQVVPAKTDLKNGLNALIKWRKDHIDEVKRRQLEVGLL